MSDRFVDVIFGDQSLYAAIELFTRMAIPQAEVRQEMWKSVQSAINSEASAVRRDDQLTTRRARDNESLGHFIRRKIRVNDTHGLQQSACSSTPCCISNNG